MQINSLIGIKTYQKQGFLQDGTRVPLTAVNVLGNVVTQIKTNDKEGYSALQIGIGTNKKAKKRKVNHAKNAGLEKTPRFFKEIRVDDTEGANLGTEINPQEVFSTGDIVDVTGISKGKGWAGGVKRFGFHGGPKTHGQSDRHRAPGSIGQGTTPGRVYKGKKMAGRMGQDTVTVKNLEVIEVTNDGVLLIKGLIPGSLEGLVMIKKMGTNKKFVPLYKEEVVAEGEGDSRQSVSADVQQSSEEQSVEPASLNDSSAPSSEETPEVIVEPTTDSAKDGQAPIASEAEGQSSVTNDSAEEVKEEKVEKKDSSENSEQEEVK